MVDYIQMHSDTGIDPDAVLRDDGVQLRRGPTREWAEFEQWMVAGGTPRRNMTREQWAKLNQHARQRALFARHAGSEPPLPVVAPDPPLRPDPPARRPQER